ncbi:MAG: hypothetical protein JO099_06790 [Acidobacteriia bacterium]|nr:hypothetical protein [Terriglobia bacterium]
MPFVFKRLALILSISAALAADKETAAFKPGSAASYENHQTTGGITLGIDPYNTAEKQKPAFGKLDLYQRGVLPVLVVIQNDGSQAIRLDNLKVEYVGPNGNHVEATPASEVRYLRGPEQPTSLPGPLGGKIKKNPLDAWEVEGRAFAAKMLPAGNSASGFFYFQTGLQRGSSLYLSGLTEAATGKELLYFEIPLLRTQ